MNEPIPLIPEFRSVSEALNDCALRVQQTLIALQIYEDSLLKVNDILPDMHVDGYELKDIPLWWGNGPKNFEEMAKNTKRSVTFVLHSAVNYQIYLLDSFLKEIAQKYYNLNFQGGPEFINDEVFSMLTKIELPTIVGYRHVVDGRRIAQGVRDVHKTHALSIPEYFETYQNICRFAHAISEIVSEKIVNDKKVEDTENE